MINKSNQGLRMVCVVCAVILLANGCAPLRKKFTRKKKEDRESNQQFIPVLEPIDYAEKQYSSEEHYKQHYSLWMIWSRDFLQAVEYDGSDKRQKYLLGQCIEQLEAMQQWLTDDQKALLGELVSDLYDIQKDYAAPPSMRNALLIKKRVEVNARAIREKF